MKTYTSDQTDIARNITITENGLELSTKDFRNNSRNSYSTKSDSDEYPFNAITYGESENLLGLPYNDHNYAMSEKKVEKIKLESKNSSHLSLLAKVALEKHEPKQYDEIKNSFNDESSVKMVKLKESRMKNIQIGNKAILLAPSNKTTLFPRQKNNIYMKHQLSLNSPANLLKNDFIRCICGYTHDDGLLAKCDKCQMHQHIDCVSPNNDGYVPTPYYCDICQPRQMRYADAVCLQREKLAFINSGCTTSSLINGMNGNGLRFRTNAATFLPGRLFVTTSGQKKSPLQLRIGTTTTTATGATSATGQIKNPGQMNLQSSQNLITFTTNNNNQISTELKRVHNYVNKQNYFPPEFINNQSSTVNFKSKRKQEFIYPSTKLTPDSSIPKDSPASNLVQVMLKNGSYYINSDRNGNVDENVPPLTSNTPLNANGNFNNNNNNNSIGGFCEENFEVLTKSRISDPFRDYLMSSKSKLSNCSILQYYYGQVNASQKNHSLQSLQKLNGPPSYQLVLLEFNQKCVLSNKFIESHEPILEVKGVIRLAEEYTNCYDYRKHFEPYVLFYKKFHKTQLVIDSREVGNCARFLRRSCSPNCEIKHVIHEDVQTNELSVRFLLFSSKPIPSKVELTIPFDFDPAQCRYNVKCACESPSCKNLSINKSSAMNLQDTDEEDSLNGASNENILQNYKMRERSTKGKPGRKPLGITNKSRGRAVINRTKKSIRKPRLETASTASSKLIALASASIKGLAKAKKTFSLRKSLIRRANATLSIAATKRKLSQTKKTLLIPNETTSNTALPMRRKNSSIHANRPPVKRSRQHSASNTKPNRGSLTKAFNSGATRSRSSIKRVNYNVDNSSSQYDEDESSAEEFDIYEKKEDESYEMIRPRVNSENNNIHLDLKEDEENMKYSTDFIDNTSPNKMNNKSCTNMNNNEAKDLKNAFLDDSFKGRNSGDRKKSGKQQYTSTRHNSSNESKSKAKHNNSNRNQSMEKSREDKWMDEVMRRIGRMEKKDRRRKNSGQNSKSLNEDCKSPDGDEMIKSMSNSEKNANLDHNLSGYQSPSLDGLKSDSNDCGLIVYKAVEKDPMAKFSRSRSNKSDESISHRGNYLSTMALIADNEFIDNANQSFYQTKMNTTTTDSQPTKKRWLTQARLEKEEEISCDEQFGTYHQSTPKVDRSKSERKQDEDDVIATSGNSQMDKLLALSMTASEILLNKSSDSTSIPNRAEVHPLKKRVLPQISPSQKETKEDDSREDQIKKDEASKKSEYSDLHLLSYALNENLEKALTEEKSQVRKEDEEGPIGKRVQTSMNEEDEDDTKKEDVSLTSVQAKKTKVSLSEYRRRKGIPFTPSESTGYVKKPSSEKVQEDEEKMRLDVIEAHADQSYLESRITELLSNVNTPPSLATSISQRNKMSSDLSSSSSKRPISPPPPPPPPMNLNNQSALIDYTVVGGSGALNRTNNNNKIQSPNVNFLLKRDIEILAWQENHLNKASRKMSQNMTSRQYTLTHTNPSSNQSQTSPDKAQYTTKRVPISNAPSGCVPGDEKDKEFIR